MDLRARLEAALARLIAAINAVDAKMVGSHETRLLTDFAENVAKQNDFTMAIIGTAANFTTAPVAAALGPNHPGVVQWRSGTTANSGVQCSTNTTSFRLGGGEQWNVNFFTAPVFTTVLFRSGALDSITSVAPVDGMYFELNGSGAVVGKCRSNNAESVTATIATLAPSTWAHGRINLNAAANLVTFTVFSDAGVQLGQATLAANIPTAAGRELGWLSLSTSTGTVAIELCHIDRQKLSNPGRTVARGAA